MALDHVDLSDKSKTFGNPCLIPGRSTKETLHMAANPSWTSTTSCEPISKVSPTTTIVIGCRRTFVEHLNCRSLLLASINRRSVRWWYGHDFLQLLNDPIVADF